MDLENQKHLLDKNLKFITYQLDVSEKNNKELSLKTIKHCELMIQDNIKPFTEKIDNVKLENGKYHLEALKMAKELKEVLLNADRIKDDLKDLWSTELQKVKDYHIVKFDSVVGDIKKIDVDLSGLHTNYRVIYVK